MFQIIVKTIAMIQNQILKYNLKNIKFIKKIIYIYINDNYVNKYIIITCLFKILNKLY